MMHDLIRDMGREIVRRESPNDPGQRSRLFLHEDILQVLQDNTGSNKVEGIKLTLSEPEEVQLTPKSFKKMKRLRILIIHNALCSGDHLEYLSNELRWLEWSGYPFSSMPVNFSPKKLVVFDMPSSRLKLSHPVSWFKVLKWVKYMNLSYCEFITKAPDLSGCRNLEDLNLDGCSRLKEFPEIVDNMDCLRKISLESTGIEELPSSIERITGLEYLKMSSCQNLTSISSCIYKLQKLRMLLLDHCTKLDKFPVFSNKKGKFMSLNEGSSNTESTSSLNLFPSLNLLKLSYCNLSEVNFLMDTEHFPALLDLKLCENNITTIPACLHNFAKLSYLDVSDCKLLQEIPELPPDIEGINADGCKSLQRYSQLISPHGDQLTRILRQADFKYSRLKEFPKFVGLTSIWLDRTGIEELSSSIECVTGLRRLHLSYCQNLTNISSCIYKLQKLEEFYLDGCSKLSKFPKFSNKKRKFTSLHEGSSNTGSTSSLNLFPSLFRLNLENCNLSEVDFLTNTEHFPALSCLWLGGNNITTIPACLHKLNKLTFLDVRNCKLLQEIPKLPLHKPLQEIPMRFLVRGCESLQISLQLESILRGGSNKDQFMSILRREGFVNIVGMLIPGNEIPEWFSHKSCGSSISFWYGHKSWGSSISLRVSINTSIAVIALALLPIGTSLTVNVFINGKVRYGFWEDELDHSMMSGNLWLCYIPQIFPSSFRGDYVDVQVKVSNFFDCEIPFKDIDLLECKTLGVHLMEG
ncbi:hypothetical protein L6164_017305 [Bauhinia variegata]|uniref:Uncharacterized protein n=1 Tax=Bauhinia variegata TaxID=167791 RepID=A0ACB9N7P0_BAUVA|nr:hypothetical protein L6164_017305 [Bauhinia variegata]